MALLATAAIVVIVAISFAKNPKLTRLWVLDKIAVHFRPNTTHELKDR